VLLDLFVYGLPILILFHFRFPILICIPLYPVLAVAIGFICSFAGKRLFVLQFSEFREPDEDQFQSLNLGKEVKPTTSDLPPKAPGSTAGGGLS
jgi:hypothetical protein